MTTTIPTPRPPSIDADDSDEYLIWYDDKAELAAEIEAAMVREGLTRAELARQAAEGEFEDYRARHIWRMIEAFGV
ncbi:hypothetical protein [Dactylosporangium darangshiense]|uniref:Uncharacterized protein n=1 Tax=Dactylosporangium darangshiense TaxID=579108 RepID=A0ABP8DAT7_9ACTN